MTDQLPHRQNHGLDRDVVLGAIDELEAQIGRPTTPLDAAARDQTLTRLRASAPNYADDRARYAQAGTARKADADPAPVGAELADVVAGMTQAFGVAMTARLQELLGRFTAEVFDLIHERAAARFERDSAQVLAGELRQDLTLAVADLEFERSRADLLRGDLDAALIGYRGARGAEQYATELEAGIERSIGRRRARDLARRARTRVEEDRLARGADEPTEA